VLARCFAVSGWPGAPKVEAKLWRLAESLLPARDIETYTQGLMDLGATICTRSKPPCVLCPLRGQCVALRRDKVDAFPTPRPGRVLPQRRTQMLVLLHGGDVLLEKRPASGIWGGLWSLPEAASGSDIRALCRRYGAEIATPGKLPSVAHGFTHFKLAIEPRRCNVTQLKLATPGTVWLPLAEAIGAAIPAPVRRILQALAS
jgi:A/G-specific adenine glycosylase